MKFTSFHIKNFKGIDSLDLALNSKAKVYTLVGLNESGKTSILEALKAFRTTVKESDRHKLIPKSQKLNFNGTISISAKLELSDGDCREIEKFILSKGYVYASVGKGVFVERKYEFKNSNPSKSNNIWTVEIYARKPEDKKKQWLYTENKEVWMQVVSHIENEYFPDVIYYQNFLFDFPDKVYLENPQNSIELDQYINVIQDILYSIDKRLNVTDHLVERLKNPNASNSEALELTLAKMSTKVSQVVFKAWEKLFARGKKEIVIRHGTEEIDGGKEYFLQFKLKEGSDQFFIAERSLGFKWFFSFLLFTEFRKHRISDRGELLFLLDEPASNLHSTAQKNLLSTFSELVDKSYLIYTTHSHHLINPDWLNGAFIVKNKALNYSDELSYDSNQTDIEILPYKRFVAQYPNQREYFQPILDILDYQPGLLEKIPNIVITEGKSDYYILKYILKNYLDSKYSIDFYPGGGATSDLPIVKLYIAWSRNFLVLRDSDKEGKKAIETYKTLLGHEISGRAFSFADVDSSLDNMSIEDLFTEDERLVICKEFDTKATKYEKSILSIAITDFLARGKTITLSADTLSRFEKVLSFISSKLKTI